ncbi:hypothetical protein SprV_0301272300 [Sparganum proliferum]
MVFTARQPQEKCQEMQNHLYTTFVDLTKAFDSVNREGLRKIRQNFGCPERFLEHGTSVPRQDDGARHGQLKNLRSIRSDQRSEAGLRPRAHPLQFHVLMDAYRDERPGIHIDHRTDRHLLNSRRMQAATRLSTTSIHHLFIADDCALNNTTEEDGQRSMDLFASGFAHFRLTANRDKTVVMHQPSPNTQHCTPPRVTVDGNKHKTLNNFAYLESKLINSTRIDGEVAHRISKNSLRRRQINTGTWEDFVQNRLAWRREVKSGAAICEANRIAATAKAKKEARKPQMPRSLNANGQPLRKSPRCQRTFRERIGLVGHLLTQCANKPKSTSPTLAPAANPAPTASSVTADHTVVVPPPSTADTFRPPPTPASTTTTTTTMTSSTPPNDGTTPDVPLPSTLTTNTPTPAMWARLIPVPDAIVHLPHTPAW